MNQKDLVRAAAWAKHAEKYEKGSFDRNRALEEAAKAARAAADAFEDLKASEAEALAG